jgi:Ca2+-binding RTX toxin-like protein
MTASRVIGRSVGSLALALSLLGMTAASAIGATCIGTSGADDLQCSSGDDYMDGLGGDDDLDGLGGYDEIHGSGGWDFLHGDNGNDSMYGEAGWDIIIGDSGNDDMHDTNASDEDYVCGLAGSLDEIWINDGLGDDIAYEGLGTFHSDPGDTLHSSETSCP